METKIENLKLGRNDTVVLDMLTNLAYMGTNEESLPSPAFKAGDGSCLIPGSLTTATPTTLKKILEKHAKNWQAQ